MDYKDYVEINKKKLDEHFWYKAKKILVDRLLNSVRGKGQTDLILNIGSGVGEDLEVMKKYGLVVALDKDPNVYEIIKGKCSEFIECDIEKHSIGKSAYSTICCFDVLEHLENDEEVLKKIYQATKKGGSFIFTVPAIKFIYSSHDIALEHKRRYSKTELRRKLKMAGFEDIELFYWNVLLSIPIVVSRIISLIKMKISKKNNYTPDSDIINKFINAVFFSVLKLDTNLFFKKKAIPFGITIYGIVKKK